MQSGLALIVPVGYLLDNQVSVDVVLKLKQYKY